MFVEAPAPNPAWLDGPVSTPSRTNPSSWEAFDRATHRLALLRSLLAPEASVFDLSHSASSIAAFAGAAPLRLSCGTLASLAPDQSFDAVTLWAGIELSLSPIADLLRIRRHIRPQGVLVVSAATSPSAPPAAQWFSESSLALALERAGFEPSTLGPQGSRIPPLSAASEAWERIRPAAARFEPLRRPIGWMDRFMFPTHARSEWVVAAYRR